MVGSLTASDQRCSFKVVQLIFSRPKMVLTATEAGDGEMWRMVGWCGGEEERDEGYC